MRPTIEAEITKRWRRSSTASLSLPQRGNCNGNPKTFSKDQVGWRLRRGHSALFQRRQIKRITTALPAIWLMPK
jgi:hypothetical protein